MKITILDNSPQMAAAIRAAFLTRPEVEVACSDLASYLDCHNVSCVVSPANSFGLMDGGFDAVITSYFGDSLQRGVQRYIRDLFHGEQPVGTAFIISIPHSDKKLIHTPSMRAPSPIRDPMVIYQCMRVTLLEAIRSGIDSIVIPVFGGGAGKVDASICAKAMYLGYMQVVSPIEKPDWNKVLQSERKLEGYGIK